MARPDHTIHFDNTPANWLTWGTLVDDWIADSMNPRPPNAVTPPRNAGVLQDQMLGTVFNPPRPTITGIKIGGLAPPLSNQERNRPVNVNPYNNGAGRPITINIPDAAMAQIDKIWLANQGSIPYPLEAFYAAIFNYAPQAILSPAQLEEMRKCRVGEYVINECM